MNKITFPIGYYPDPTKGKPISGGSIYIGEPDTDPTISGNQKTVTALQENGSEVSMSQPISTSAGGVPLYNGSPVTLFVVGEYSMRVDNSQDSQVYYTPNSSIGNTEIIEYFDTVADMIAGSLNVGSVYATKGYYTSGDGGGAKYLIKTSAEYGGTPDEYGDHTLNSGDIAVLQYEDAANVRCFGAKGDGVTDDSAAITAAITAATNVLVPSGDYRCDSMLELTTQKTLQLEGGTSLIRYSAYSASTDPVVWIKGNSAVLFGTGKDSIIYTENKSPKGVVRLGHKDMTESHDNVLYCSLRDLRIKGSTQYGQTSGDPDIALYMPNPQFSGLASYFHQLYGLLLQDANYGLYLHGWANANTITHIQGYRLGNVTSGHNAFVYCYGALDNAVSNCFFHFSADSIGLLVDEYDNTGNGGSVHTPYANSFSNFVCEQGGTTDLGLKALAGGGSFYEMRPNVSGGNSLFANFYDSNTFIALNSVNSNSVKGENKLEAPTLFLAGGATDDSAHKSHFDGGVRVYDTIRVGEKSTRTYSGTGTMTVVATFGTTLTGATWRNALIEVIFKGMTTAAANEEYSRYYVPVKGLSTWNIGTPVNIYGNTITITQTDNSSSSVTFTVAGGSTSQRVSVGVEAWYDVGVALS